MAQEAVYRATEGDSTLQDLLRTVGVSASFRAKGHCHDPVDLLLTMRRHEVFQEQISTLNFVIFHWRSHQPSVNVHVLHIEGSFEVTRWRSYYELVWYFVRIHHVHLLAREQYKTVKCKLDLADPKGRIIQEQVYFLLPLPFLLRYHFNARLSEHLFHILFYPYHPPYQGL